MKNKVQSVTDKGSVRSNNEDAIQFGYNPEADFDWMVVADGMGGHQAGEVASKMVVSILESELAYLSQSPTGGWKSWLKELVMQANQAVFNAAQKNPAYQAMGTTVVLAIIEKETLHFVWVGDSRLYCFQDDQLQQLSKDHSMIQFLLDKGAISEKEAEESNTKNILAKAIGVKEEVEADYASHKVAAGNVIMLSTDGFHDIVTNDEICKWLLQAREGKNVVDAMVTQALEKGSKDNVTIGLICVQN